MKWRFFTLMTTILLMIGQSTGIFAANGLSKEKLMTMSKEEIIEYYEKKLGNIKKTGLKTFDKYDALINSHGRFLSKTQSFMLKVSQIIKFNLELRESRVHDAMQELEKEKDNEALTKKLLDKQTELVSGINKHIKTLNKLAKSKDAEIKRVSELIEEKQKLVAEKENVIEEKEIRINELLKGIYRPFFQVYIQGGANYYQNVYQWSDRGIGANGSLGTQLNFDYIESLKGFSLHIEGGYDTGNLNGKAFIKYKFF